MAGSGVRGTAVAAALVVASLFFSSWAAAAQDADTTRAGPDAAPDTVAYELSPLEVVVSIAPTAATDVASGIPARISTLSGDDIGAWEPRLLSEALAAEAGVSVYDDLGSPFKLNLSTRGFQAGPTVGLPSGVSVFLDGIPQNEPGAQEVNFDLLPLEHVQRVELLRGNASLLGPNSLGGAVNLITRRGAPESAGELEVSAGSFGSVSARGRFEGALGSGWEVYGGGGYGEEGGWRHATGAERFDAVVNVDRSSSGRGLHMQALWTRSRAETAGSLPESIFGDDPLVNFTAGDFEDLELRQVALSGFHPLLGGRGSLKAYLRYSDGERFNVNQPPDEDVRSLYENGTAGAVADWRREIHLGRSVLSVRGGLDLASNRVRVRIFEEERGGGARELTTEVESPSVDLAVYSMADLALDRVTLSAGARFDYIRIPFEDILDPTADTVSRYTRVSPRAGVSLEVGGGAFLYGSAGTAFRAPAILELACSDPEDACPLPFALGDDPPLDAVAAVTYEVGGRWRRGTGELSVSAYRSEVSDEIFFVPSEASIVEGYFRNFGDTRREGVEVAARAAPGSRSSFYASYAYTRATFRSEEEIFSARADQDFTGSGLAGDNVVRPGDRLPMVPSHQLKAGGAHRFPVGVEVGLDGRYFGEQWLRGDEANETRPLQGYILANARVGYRLGAWELETIVRNLLDADEAVFGTFNVNQQSGELERFLTPLETRSWRFRLRRSFGGS